MKEIAFIAGRSSFGKESLMASFLALSAPAVLADCSLEYNALLKIVAPFNRREICLPYFRGFGLDNDRCTHCGMCLGVCMQHALEIKEGQMQFLEYRCSHCGSCIKWCPAMALSHEEDSGVNLYSGDTRFGPVVYTHTFIEPSLQAELVMAVRKNARRLAAESGARLILINGSRGLRNTSLSAVEEADAIVAVISPSAYAADDLHSILRFSRKAGREARVIINMHDFDSVLGRKLEAVCNRLKISVAGIIPYHPAFIKALEKGMTLKEMEPETEIAQRIAEIWERIQWEA